MTAGPGEDAAEADVGARLAEQTVEKLRGLCRRAGLPVSGRKAELVRRVEDSARRDPAVRQLVF